MKRSEEVTMEVENEEKIYGDPGEEIELQPVSVQALKEKALSASLILPKQNALQISDFPFLKFMFAITGNHYSNICLKAIHCVIAITCYLYNFAYLLVCLIANIPEWSKFYPIIPVALLVLNVCTCAAYSLFFYSSVQYKYILPVLSWLSEDMLSNSVKRLTHQSTFRYLTGPALFTLIILGFMLGPMTYEVLQPTIRDQFLAAMPNSFERIFLWYGGIPYLCSSVIGLFTGFSGVFLGDFRTTMYLELYSYRFTEILAKASKDDPLVDEVIVKFHKNQLKFLHQHLLKMGRDVSALATNMLSLPFGELLVLAVGTVFFDIFDLDAASAICLLLSTLLLQLMLLSNVRNYARFHSAFNGFRDEFAMHVNNLLKSHFHTFLTGMQRSFGFHIFGYMVTSQDAFRFVYFLLYAVLLLLLDYKVF